MQFYAYLWLREDGTPFYAGKGSGKRAFVRGSHHLRPPKDRSRILIFDKSSEAEALAAEKELIAHWGRNDQGTGCLRNFTDGGDGVSGLRHTADAKRRMSEGHRGVSTWNKGRSASPESKAAMSEGQRRRTDARNKGKHWKLSKAHCQKLSIARKGHFTSEETKKKISQSHLGMKPTEETLLKMKESHKGQRPTLATRQKLSAAIKQSWILRRQQGKTNGKLRQDKCKYDDDVAGTF